MKKNNIVEFSKKEKGVTLIALVVTIVVLLILASITIANLTSEKGVIGEAKTAKEQTERRGIEEQIELAIVNVEKNHKKPTMKDVIEELKNSNIISNDSQVDKETGTITSDLGGYVFEEILKDYVEKVTLADQLEIGDYIQYGDKLSVKTYKTDTNQTGYNTRQSFKTNNTMLWRVINKKSNGEVEIVAVNNIVSESDEGLCLQNEAGFLNAEIVLNDLCNQLFSNPSYGEARSIKVEDINRLTGFDRKTSDWIDKDNLLR